MDEDVAGLRKSFGSSRAASPDAVSYRQVERAARDLMKLGERPTVRAVIKAMGKGSPNVVADCLRRFWKDTAAMGTGDPLSLMRLPPELADAAVAQWSQALRFAQQSVRHDESAALARLDELQREADSRVRSIELREKEWDMAARVRETALADARVHLAYLMNEQGRDRAAIREKDAQIALLEAEVAAKRGELTALIKRAAKAPRARASQRVPRSHKSRKTKRRTTAKTPPSKRRSKRKR